MYSKQSGWNTGNGFASANQDGPVLYGNQSVIIGNLNSSNTETTCAIFNGTTTSLLGTVNTNTPTATPSRLNIQSFGTQLGLINNVNGYVYMSSLSDGSFQITCNNPLGTPTYLQYCFDSTWSSAGQNTVPRMRLSGFSCPTGTSNNFRTYLRNTAGDIQICLFNQNDLSPSYGFGANNSCIQYLSAGVNGHRFYYHSSSRVGIPAQLGSLLATIDGNGNMIAQSGLRASGYNPNYTGKGSEVHFTANTAAFFGYDRTGGA